MYFEVGGLLMAWKLRKLRRSGLSDQIQKLKVNVSVKIY